MPGKLIRIINFIAFIGCIVLLAMAAYLQYFKGLEPCPLCVLQRLGFLLLALLFFVGCLYRQRQVLGVRIHGTLVFITAFLGFLVAARQVWIQHLPLDQLPTTCGPDLNYMLSNFPLSQSLQLILQGSGECAHIGWEFLGLSLAEWSLVAFLVFCGIGLFQLLIKPTTKN